MIRFQAIGSRISACTDAATGIPATFFKRASRAGTAGRRNGRIAPFSHSRLSVSNPSAWPSAFLLRFGFARDEAVNHGLTLNGLQRDALRRGFGVGNADGFEHSSNLRRQNNVNDY